MSTRRHVALAILPLLALAAALPARAEQAREVESGWRWTVAPYVWGPGLSGNTSLPDRTTPGGGGVSVDAGSLFDALEFGALVRWGGTSEHWRILGDAAYVGLGQRSKRDLAKTSVDVAMAELAGAWRPNQHFDVLFGARYWNTDIGINFDNPLVNDVDRTRDWVDPFVGFRALTPLGESWDFCFRGDIGGFGVGSDLTWNAEMLFAWNATDHFSLVLGYRHIALDDDWDGGTEEVDVHLAMSGPEVGFAFHF